MNPINNFINWLFRHNKVQLSKWEYWELFELLEDLHEAEKLLSQFKGGYSGEFLSAESFHEALVDAIDDLEKGNLTDLTIFYYWFAPTTQWDDFTGIEGLELGDRIFERVSKWMKTDPEYRHLKS